jgi:predicted RNA-binding Zn ribbon-like protein
MCLLACDFLDEKPYSELTNENLEVGFGKDSVKYTTAVQAEQLINGAYSDFASEFWQLDLYIMNDAQADNAYAGESKDQTVQIDQLRLISTNGNVSRDWNYIYTHISKANTILTYVPAIADPALTETRKNEILGEAAFMRAICYFNLVRIYGSVPMILQAIPEISMENLEEVYPLLYPAQSSVEDIYAQIVKDLEYAQANVADYSAFKFKITKAFANLLLAEVYATKDGVEKTDWTSVKKYAEKVVNDGRYGLLPHYNDVFAVANPLEKGILPYLDLLNENSKESIFEVDYNSWTTLGNWAGQMFVGIDWKKFNTPSHDLYDAFTREGDLVRRDASILLYDVSGKWTDTYWPSSAYPYSWKIRAQEKNNIVLYRLPEAILLLADAENELGNTAKAAQLVNQIRTRAGLPNTTAAIKEDMRLAIENEHRFEFAFEGKRWMDLKRRGRFIQAMRACTDHQREYGLAMKETQLLWPIPQSELDLNRNLKQNPGY